MSTLTKPLPLKALFMWLVTLGLPLGIYFIPTSDLFTNQMKIFLIVTVFAILIIAFESLPKSVITILLPVSYILLGLADPQTAWFPWTMPTVWMIIGALLLVNALESSGLLMRISYHVILLVGGSYKGLILGLGAVGILLNIILFGNAYVMLVGLAYGLCHAMNLEKYSKEATGIFLAAAIGGIIPAAFCYGSNILMLEGLGEPVVGAHRISYLSWTFLNIPVIFYYFCALLLILVLFRSQSSVDGKAYVKGKLAELGRMSVTEKKACAWLVILFAYIITAGFKGWDSTWAFVIVPALTIAPVIGCGTEKDVRRLDFTFILFIASCMSIGIVASALDFGSLVTSVAEPLTDNASPGIVVFAIYGLNIILNFLLTPMAIMAGFTTTYLQIAQTLGINPYVIYSVISLGTDQILFPYEYALYMLYFSLGYIKMSDFIKYFGAKMLLCSVLLIIVIIPFWKLTGLFFG
ncbi:SLC13 family permease [Peptococcus simiae]|uniref:Sodium-dependent dicarboxylate transporter SdcS n=1 Tax=Peptococcus simiae TaxID=1643805 RepID=A0ABW9GZP5_9FIRM